MMRKTAVGVIAGSVLLGMASVNLGTSAGAQSTTQPLSAVVGETVVVTTDQAGKATPFNVVLVNSQVSGQGQGTLTIPLGEHGTKTMDLTNSTGQVQNSFSLSGPYQPKLPISVVTTVKVNGQSVPADKAYNLTGEVEITYTMTNHTAREQTITYTNVAGQTVTEQAQIPVPFGNEFRVTYGDGWFIEDPGKMTQKTVPGGTGLSTTAILFPLIPGVAGGTTQTVTVKARAQNASLPGTTSNAVALDLRTYDGGLATKIGPGINNGILRPIDSLLDGALGEIMGAAGLISGWTGSFQSLNVNYVDPLVAEIKKTKLNPDSLNQQLTNLDNGLTQLAVLLQANQVSAKVVSAELNKAAAFAGVDLAAMVKWFESLITEAGPGATEAAQALTTLSTVMGGLDPATLQQFVTPGSDMQNWCGAVGGTSKFYGYDYGLKANSGADALDKALNPVTGVPLTSQERADLTQLQKLLDSQSVGTLPTKGAFKAGTVDAATTTTLLTALLKSQGLSQAEAKALAQFVVKALGQPGCVNTTMIINGVVLPLANDWASVSGAIPGTIDALNAIAAASTNPAIKKVFTGVLKVLDGVSRKLSNGSGCTNADIVNPIIQGIDKYGVGQLKAHLGPIVDQMLEHCGLSQIVAFLGGVDGLLGDSLASLSTKISGLSADLPKVANAASSVGGIATVAGDVFDAIPRVGGKVDEVVGGITSKVGAAGENATTKVSNYASSLNATVLAMSERTAAGDGSPYGNATGANASTVSIYQITQEPAAPYTNNWTTALALAVVFLLLAVGLGTFLHRRRRLAALAASASNAGGPPSGGSSS